MGDEVDGLEVLGTVTRMGAKEVVVGVVVVVVSTLVEATVMGADGFEDEDDETSNGMGGASETGGATGIGGARGFEELTTIGATVLGTVGDTDGLAIVGATVGGTVRTTVGIGDATELALRRVVAVPDAPTEEAVAVEPAEADDEAGVERLGSLTVG